MPRSRSPQPERETPVENLFVFVELTAARLVTDVDEILVALFRRENGRQVESERFRIVLRPEIETRRIVRRHGRSLDFECKNTFRFFDADRFLMRLPNQHGRGEEEQIGDDCAFTQGISNDHEPRRATPSILNNENLQMKKQNERGRKEMHAVIFHSIRRKEMEVFDLRRKREKNRFWSLSSTVLSMR